ncbi:hypothetical protein QQ045_031192 [Rhodiola kirilowii]
MGLNDIHAQVRTQILSTRPQPTLDEAYSLVVNDETEKRLTKPVVTEASALFSSYNNQHHMSFNQSADRQNANLKTYNNGDIPNQNRNRRPLLCTYCQTQGHTKEACYKLNGYPCGKGCTHQ